MNLKSITPHQSRMAQVKEAAEALDAQEKENAAKLPAGYRYGTVPGKGPIKLGK